MRFVATLVYLIQSYSMYLNWPFGQLMTFFYKHFSLSKHFLLTLSEVYFPVIAYDNDVMEVSDRFCKTVAFFQQFLETLQML